MRSRGSTRAYTVPERTPFEIEFSRVWKNSVVMEMIGKEAHPVRFSNPCARHQTFGPVHVPEGQYLMLGDNSADSRVFGFVKGELIMITSAALGSSLF